MTTATETMPRTSNTTTPDITAEERMTWAIAGQATRGVRENGDGSFTKVEVSFKSHDRDAARQLRRAGHAEAEDVLRAAADRALESAPWLAPLARIEAELAQAHAKLATADTALAEARSQREALVTSAPEGLGERLAAADAEVASRAGARDHAQQVVDSLQEALVPARKEAEAGFEGLVGLVQGDAQTRCRVQRTAIEAELAEAAGAVLGRWLHIAAACKRASERSGAEGALRRAMTERVAALRSSPPQEQAQPTKKGRKE